MSNSHYFQDMNYMPCARETTHDTQLAETRFDETVDLTADVSQRAWKISCWRRIWVGAMKE